jgi:hypothetical protein
MREITSNTIQNTNKKSYPKTPTKIPMDDPSATDTEFEWRPTDTNYGDMFFSSNFCHLSSDNYFPPVPWSHGRDDIPLWLVNQGVPLNSWQNWVDRATSIWMERNRRKLNMYKAQCFLFLCFFLMIILATMQLESDTIDIPFFILIVLFILSSLKSNFDSLQVEAMWSDLIQDMNCGICKDLGIQVKPKQDQQDYYSWYYWTTQDGYILKSVTYYSTYYTVGLIFIIERGMVNP